MKRHLLLQPFRGDLFLALTFFDKYASTVEEIDREQGKQ